MTEDEYIADHPDLDYEKVFDACVYALQQLHVAAHKEADAPCSAEEHRSMAYRRLRDAIAVNIDQKAE